MRLIWRLIRRLFRRSPAPPSLSAPVKAVGAADHLHRLAEVPAVFGDENIEARAFGVRGVFLSLPAAEEVARRLQFLSEIEARGYL